MDKSFAEALAKYREENYLSRPALARMLGVDSHTVYGWEKRGTMPRGDNMRAVLALEGFHWDKPARGAAA